MSVHEGHEGPEHPAVDAHQDADMGPSLGPPFFDPPAPIEGRLARADAEELGRTIQSVATAQAQTDARFLDLIGAFDAGEAITHFHQIKSTVHWLSWACSMALGTAREHVRVARALRTLPRTRELLAEGRLTYSKVREITRIAELMREEELCDLALEMTASQLARTVRAYRAAPGTRINQEDQRRLLWRESENGMVRLSVCLSAEEAALVRAALDTAASHQHPDQDASDMLPHPDGSGVDEGPSTRSRPQAPDLVQALVDVATGYLTADLTELGDDRHLVVVHVNADQLTDSPTTAAAGESSGSTEAATPETSPNVPAGTRGGSSARSECFIEDAGPGRVPIEPETAARLTCNGQLLGAIIGTHGQVLALGRTRRRASRAQRRALRIRDHGMCQFPGCHVTTHLEAHHIIPWLPQGLTDLTNLILLCKRHHMCCHEGGISIVARHETGSGSTGRASGHWQFLMPDGRAVQPPASWLSPEGAQRTLIRDLQRWFDVNQEGPPRVFPPHGGAGFSLFECAQVLFDITLPIDEPSSA